MVRDNVVGRSVVILPPQTVSDEAIRCSKLITEKFGGHFSLDATTHLPHLLIYQCALPEKNLDAFAGHIRRIAQNTRPLKITMTGHSTFNGTAILWNARGRTLSSLHSAIVRKVNPLRDGYVLPQHAPLLTSEAHLTTEQRLSLASFGHPLSGKTFFPHIALTDLGEVEDVQEALKMLSLQEIDFTASEIHITEIREMGTCPGSDTMFQLGV